MTCKFNSECTSNCPKYTMCSYYAIQSQISEINAQIASIYQSLNNLFKLSIELKQSSNKTIGEDFGDDTDSE
jgi:hypothetical protein